MSRPDQTNQPILHDDTAAEKVDVTGLHAPIMREKLDPRDGYEPIPIWLVAAFGGLLFWGGYYLATYNGGFRADVLDETPQARMNAGSQRPRTLDPVALGQRLFLTCAACHGADGAGRPGYPPLAGSDWVTGDPSRAKRILLHGLEGPLTVNGQHYNNVMPAFGTKYTDEQIAALLTYIRQAWGNAAPAVPTESVTATRLATPNRATAWTATELLTITADDYAAPTTTPAP